MKELLYRLRPFRIYIVLVLSIIYFLVQLFLSHITHALTLLVDSYHMLCNIVALSGCITTIKHFNAQHDDETVSLSNELAPESSIKVNEFIGIRETKANRHENSLRNTFGWTRIDILTMLIVGIFLAAFCFSLLVEAIQTLIHIDHQDTMHFPKAVFALGFGGLILNCVCYILIGGYTYHQGNFLHVTSTGNVVLNRVGKGEGLFRGSFQLSKINQSVQTTISTPSIQLVASTSSSTSIQTQSVARKPTLNEFLRDISSTIFVIICSTIVYFSDTENVNKFIDPIISIISCMTLLVLSYPYMKESCLILLQTIPASIDIELFKADLLKTFDEIVSVHDLHIWQLTSTKYVSTVHILFHNPNVYVNTKDSLFAFFQNQGITIVTIQPEFKEESNDKTKNNSSLTPCLIGCRQICAPKTCCSESDLDMIVMNDGKKKKKDQKLKTGKKSNSMLILNVSSLSKGGSSQEIIKKSVSESHVGQINSNECSDSQTTSANVSIASNWDIVIDELNEKQFNGSCGARINERLSSIEQQPNSRKTDSKSEYENSSLLNRDISNIISTAKAEEDAVCLFSKL